MATSYHFCDGMYYDANKHKTRPIITLNTKEEAIKKVKEGKQWMEYLSNDQLTKLYFDFDKIVDKHEDSQIEGENEYCLDAIINQLFDGRISKDDIAIAERHRPLEDGKFKISFRYFIKRGFVIPYPYIKPLLEEYGITCFDTSVYKPSEQLLGCVFNHKAKGVPILAPVTNDNVEDFIVQVLPDDAIVMRPPANHQSNNDTTKTQHVDNDKESSGNNIVEFDILRQVVMGLSPKRSIGYIDWTEVIWAVFNISGHNGYMRQGNGLIHEFSKQSPKYDENKVETFLYKHTKEMEHGLGLGTLIKRLQEDNEVEANRIKLLLNPVKPIQLNGYSFVDEPEEAPINLLDGQKRDYSTMKSIFEQTNFKVCDKKVVYVELKKVDGELVLKDRTRAEAIEAFENYLYYSDDLPKNKHGKDNFFTRWIKDPQIRSYEDMDFLPPPIKVRPSTFNLWKGFRVQKINVHVPKEERAELLAPIYKHLAVVCNNDEQSIKYFRKWIAHLIQKPAEKNGIAICFRSEEGTGKGSLVCDFLGKLIIGEEYYWESSDCVNDLFGKHSVAFHRRLLVNIDEPKVGDLRQNSDRFKSLITSNRQRLEDKGKTIRQVFTCERYIITTNNEDVLKLSTNARRFVVIQCSDELIGNTDYFDNLHQYIQRPDVQKAFYDDMLEEDISGFDWKRERPVTEAYTQNMDTCVSPHVRFMAGFVKRYEACKVPEVNVSGKELFKDFNKTLASCKSRYACEYTVFTRMVTKMAGITKGRNMYGLWFDVDINVLKEHLQKKEKFDFVNYQFYEYIDDSDEN